MNKVIKVPKTGKVGQSLFMDCYHILKTYLLVTLGGVEKVVKNDKNVFSKNIVGAVHMETGHKGERKHLKCFN